MCFTLYYLPKDIQKKVILEIDRELVVHMILFLSWIVLFLPLLLDLEILHPFVALSYLV